MRTSLLPWCLLVGSVSLLAACAGDQKKSDVQVLDAKPDGIMLRAPENNPQLAGITADEHCAQYGKIANLVRERDPKGFDELEEPGTAVYAFACIPASAPR